MYVIFVVPVSGRMESFERHEPPKLRLKSVLLLQASLNSKGSEKRLEKAGRSEPSVAFDPSI